MNQSAGKKWNDLMRMVAERPVLVVAMVSLIAFALRIYDLNARTLFGDEYGSILEAQEFGRNLQSLPYFGVLHLWLLLGSSDFWVRFPSVVFGVLTVPVSYLFGRRAVSRQTGLLLAGLLALSSFAIEYSQETRFYSLFLLTTTLSLVSFVKLAKDTASPRLRLAWAATSLLVILSHLFGILVPVFEAAGWWIGSVSAGRRNRRLGLFIIVLMGCIVLVPLLASHGAFNLVERLYGSPGTTITSQSRGLGLVNFAKMPLTLFMFALGQSAYPIALPSVLGALLFGVAALVGLVSLRGRPLVLALALFAFLPLILVYLVFDPAVPAFSDTAAPRYVIMVLPIFLFLVATGLAGGHFKNTLAFGIGLVLIYSLAEYFGGNWSYTIPVNVNWRDAASFVADAPNSKTVVLYDGRSAAPVDRYFDPGLTKRSYWPYLQSNNLTDLAEAQTIVFVTNDSKEGNRQGFNEFIKLLERDHVSTKGQVRYPVFEYAFERKTSPKVGYSFDPTTHQVALPREIYGLEFQDLALPAQASFEGFDYPLSGSFALPNLEGDRERLISFADAPPSTALVLLSNVTAAGQLRQGVTIGELVVSTIDGGKQSFPLRLGDETQQWSLDCPADKLCQSALVWHKLAVLLGQRTYEGAWSDFQAKIFGARLGFSNPMVVQSIAIRYLASSGQLNVWGIAFR